MKKLILLLIFVFGTAHGQWPGAKEPQKGKPKAEKFGIYSKGNSATGGEGCYFGEGKCGETGKVDEKTKEEVEDPAPVKKKKRRVPSDENDEKTVVNAKTTNICQTPVLWCVMQQTGAPGMPCYCNVPVAPGFINGITIAR